MGQREGVGPGPEAEHRRVEFIQTGELVVGLGDHAVVLLRLALHPREQSIGAICLSGHAQGDGATQVGDHPLGAVVVAAPRAEVLDVGVVPAVVVARPARAGVDAQVLVEALQRRGGDRPVGIEEAHGDRVEHGGVPVALAGRQLLDVGRERAAAVGQLGRDRGSQRLAGGLVGGGVLGVAAALGDRGGVA